MGRLIGRIVVEQHGTWWIVREPLRYEGCGVIHVPEGFVTDWASIPRMLWPVFAPSDPRWSAAAIVHDRIYETHERTRRVADRMFRDAMAAGGTPGWLRWLFWAGVRLGGRRAYRTGPARQRERHRVAEGVVAQ